MKELLRIFFYTVLFVPMVLCGAVFVIWEWFLPTLARFLHWVYPNHV